LDLRLFFSVFKVIWFQKVYVELYIYNHIYIDI
jgi:hypothetical protein